MKSPESSPSARALKAARAGDWPLAQAILTALISEVFSLQVESLQISRDQYSLNSLNGFVRIVGNRDYFFKFHHEEGEEVTLQELYRGELLKEAGFPVDMPAFVSKSVGRQLLMYVRRTSPRVADVCEPLDFAPLAEAASVLQAQVDLDSLALRIYSQTLHWAPPDVVALEPINQLFYHRLMEPGRPRITGGRARRFFWDRTFDVAGTELSAEALRSAKWTVNGISYDDTIEALLERSRDLLEPTGLARFGAVTAHGDAHNANVWWEDCPPDPPRMVFFDPAFAGSHVCALLAEVKATFHNIFAHPLWLYQPSRATDRYRAISRYNGMYLEISTDWRLSPLRERFLAAKAEHLWRPLLKRLRDSDLLPADWRATLRCALFCCPTLVMDLCAGGVSGHTPTSSALALAMAVAAGSEPAPGSSDVLSSFLDSIDPSNH